MRLRLYEHSCACVNVPARLIKQQEGPAPSRLHDQYKNARGIALCCMCCASLSAACCIECVLELLNTQIMPGLPFLSLVLVVVAVAVEASPLEDRSFLALCKLQRAIFSYQFVSQRVG